MAYVLNGVYHAQDELLISWRDPFFATGLGVFETLRTIGGKPMFLLRHLERLLGGAATLRLPAKLALDELSDQIELLMSSTGLAEARIKICLLLAEGGVDVLVTAEEAPSFFPKNCPKKRPGPRFSFRRWL